MGIKSCQDLGAATQKARNFLTIAEYLSDLLNINNATGIPNDIHMISKAS
jgi:hypothetical protein